MARNNLSGKWTRQRAIPRPRNPLIAEDVTRCADALTDAADRMRALAEAAVSEDRATRLGALASLLIIGHAASLALVEFSGKTDTEVEAWQ